MNELLVKRVKAGMVQGTQNMKDSTDDELLEASKAGNARAFKILVERYESRVAATIIAMIGRGPEADDLGQETFIRFYKNLHKFRKQSSIGTYITRIAMNLTITEIRRRKRRRSEPLDAIPAEYLIQEGRDAAQYEEANSVQIQNMIQLAISKLSEKHRAVVVLRLFNNYSTAETADILSIPMGTVMSRLKRAQEKLKNMILPKLEEVE